MKNTIEKHLKAQEGFNKSILSMFETQSEAIDKLSKQVLEIAQLLELLERKYRI